VLKRFIMTSTLNPYLNFNGQCREAMMFYKSCFGGDLEIQKVAESPMAAEMPSEATAHILHSRLVAGDVVLMGSDMMGKNLVQGNKVGLCLNCRDEAEVNAFFNNLAEGGKVVTPLHQTFWGATYGELTDKFGLNWMFNYTKDE
jgi:PhnB protein